MKFMNTLFYGLKNVFLFAATSVVIWVFNMDTAQAKSWTVNCPRDSATLSSINVAVGASSPGDSITVCPGIYLENVVVTKDHLKLSANPSGSAKIYPGDPLQAAFQIKANFNVIEGFVVSGFSSGISIQEPFGHAVISDNILAGNINGIFFGNSLSNWVKDNDIQFNTLDGIIDIAKPILASDQENVYLSNTIHFNLGNGILIQTGPGELSHYARALVRRNEIKNNKAVGLVVSFSSHVQVLDNTSSRNGRSGIELVSTINSTVSGNHTNKNGASRLLCGPSKGIGNCSGIRVNSPDNQFEDNKAEDNLVWDAQDLTLGSGTAETANTWTNNKCDLDSPTGLCVR